MKSTPDNPVILLGEGILAGMEEAPTEDREIFYKIHELELGARRMLGEIAWSNYPPLMREQSMSNSEKAAQLAGVAFKDALMIAENAFRFITSASDEATNDPIQILKRSRGLLSAGRLQEIDKNFLFSEIFNPSRGRIQPSPGTEEFAVLDSVFVWHHRQSGEVAVDWHPVISGWIKQNLRPGTGCPAHELFTELDGKKVSYINAFWSLLIDKAYVQPVAEGDTLTEPTTDSSPSMPVSQTALQQSDRGSDLVWL